MKFRCHTSLEYCLTEGKTYDAYFENEESYFITDDDGLEHEFTKEPDNYGLSYKTWLEII